MGACRLVVAVLLVALGGWTSACASEELGRQVQESSCPQRAAWFARWLEAVIEEGVGYRATVPLLVVEEPPDGRTIPWSARIEIQREVVVFEANPMGEAESPRSWGDDLAHALPDPGEEDRVLVIAEPAAPWPAIAAIAEIAIERGYGGLSFLVDATPELAPPPPSRIRPEIDRLHEQTALLPDWDSPTLADRVYASCPAALEVLADSAGRGLRGSLEHLGVHLPAALERCGCSVDLPSVRDLVWLMLDRFDGVVTRVLDVPIAVEGAELALSSEATWADGHREFAAASGPVRLAVRGKERSGWLMPKGPMPGFDQAPPEGFAVMSNHPAIGYGIDTEEVFAGLLWPDQQLERGIRKRIRTHRGKLALCSPANSPSPGEPSNSTAVAFFQIDPDGSVARVRVEGDLDRWSRGCIASMIRNISFPPSGRDSYVRYPFRFGAGKSIEEDSR
jgi:hypothetical protein